MGMPQELKEQLIGQFNAAVAEAQGSMLDQGYDAGAASVPGGGGFTQEQVDQIVANKLVMFKSAAKAAVDTHDADTQNDNDLKAMIDQIVV